MDDDCVVSDHPALVFVYMAGGGMYVFADVDEILINARQVPAVRAEGLVRLLAAGQARRDTERRRCMN